MVLGLRDERPTAVFRRGSATAVIYTSRTCFTDPRPQIPSQQSSAPLWRRRRMAGRLEYRPKTACSGLASSWREHHRAWYLGTRKNYHVRLPTFHLSEPHTDPIAGMDGITSCTSGSSGKKTKPPYPPRYQSRMPVRRGQSLGYCIHYQSMH